MSKLISKPAKMAVWSDIHTLSSIHVIGVRKGNVQPNSVISYALEFFDLLILNFKFLDDFYTRFANEIIQKSNKILLCASMRSHKHISFLFSNCMYPT